MVLPVGAPNNLLSQRPTTLRPKASASTPAERQAAQVLPAPLVVQHVAQNQHTEVQLGLAPTGGGGFFASGLLRTRQSRPRALSMMPLTRSASQDEVGYEKAPLLTSRSKQSSSRQSRHKYYPLSQEETLELLYLLNQGEILCHLFIPLVMFFFFDFFFPSSWSL
ncbi:hypothetical protein Y032_0072g702 [Ancylostoma ceylanicum]|uniref:Uncharacterized protein n=1 Tax=Ancylostoma ceylanicum TaxID=53326 RepID=A0A016TX02_9BILA|nr:hypothetical protein Y032_0072g702 [Ancylostoma ceylanicum]